MNFIDYYRFFLLWRDTPFFLKGAAGKQTMIGAPGAHWFCWSILDFRIEGKGMHRFIGSCGIHCPFLYLHLGLPNMWDICICIKNFWMNLWTLGLVWLTSALRFMDYELCWFFFRTLVLRRWFGFMYHIHPWFFLHMWLVGVVSIFFMVAMKQVEPHWKIKSIIFISKKMAWKSGAWQSLSIRNVLLCKAL